MRKSITKRLAAIAVIAIASLGLLASPAQASGPVSAPFPFPFPSCPGVTAGTYTVVTTSDDNYPRVQGIREFTDKGSYVATLDKHAFAGRYFDHFVQVVRGHVTVDADGNVTNADDYRLHRIIVLWDHGHWLFTLLYNVHLYHYHGTDIAPTKVICGHRA